MLDQQQRVSKRIFEKEALKLLKKKTRSIRTISPPPKKPNKIRGPPTVRGGDSIACVPVSAPSMPLIEVPALARFDFDDDRVRRRMLVAFALGMMYPSERRTIEMCAPRIRWKLFEDHIQALWVWRRRYSHGVRNPPIGTVVNDIDVGQFVTSVRNIGMGDGIL
jgi:hypothetical protein